MYMSKIKLLLFVLLAVSAVLADNFSQFLGENRNGVVTTGKKLLKKWPAEGPKELWRVKVGGGFAAPVVFEDKLFILDYNTDKEEDTVKCLDMKDGKEAWSYGYPSKIKPSQYDYSRTVPAVNGKYVVTLGTNCLVSCLEKDSGKLAWQKNLVKEYGSKVPGWYAGQNPLIDGDKVIILVAGDKVLMAAFDLASGKTAWETPCESNWGMTHNSLTVMDFEKEKFYIGCSKKGAFGVAAADGKLRWTHPGWTVKTANIPAPLVIGKDRIFFTGGYGAGSLILGLKKNGNEVVTEEITRLTEKDFGSKVQTPILYKDNIYGASGEIYCLDLNGKVLWKSSKVKVGLGPCLIIDGLLYVLGDTGTLFLLEPTASGYKEISKFAALTGKQMWAPLAVSGGKLVIRSMTEMLCLDIAESGAK